MPHIPAITNVVAIPAALGHAGAIPEGEAAARGSVCRYRRGYSRHVRAADELLTIARAEQRGLISNTLLEPLGDPIALQTAH